MLDRVSSGRPFHEPVLFNEVIDGLALSSGDAVIDATVGGGGHAAGILDRIGPNGRLLGIDEDPIALAASAERLAPVKERVTLVESSFDHLAELIKQAHFPSPVRAILFDLGVSSRQFDDPEAGFSFLRDGPLDMRRSGKTVITAEHIVNQWSSERLASLFRDAGEEPEARRFVNAIVNERRHHPIRRTVQLAHLIEKVARGSVKRRIHPATRIFQALRIAVNDELGNLERALPQALDLLAPEGRLAVIAFHSLEDRIVKHFFRNEQSGCICPPQLPICQCGHQPRLTILTKKPLRPTAEEQHRNPRSRSAKLRLAVKRKQ